jgi:hypothetical protein
VRLCCSEVWSLSTWQEYTYCVPEGEVFGDREICIEASEFSVHGLGCAPVHGHISICLYYAI